MRNEPEGETSRHKGIRCRRTENVHNKVVAHSPNNIHKQEYCSENGFKGNIHFTGEKREQGNKYCRNQKWPVPEVDKKRRKQKEHIKHSKNSTEQRLPCIEHKTAHKEGKNRINNGKLKLVCIFNIVKQNSINQKSKTDSADELTASLNHLFVKMFLIFSIKITYQNNIL